MAQLPRFIYHEDPLGTGAILPAASACICCGEVRGFIYSGPVFSLRDDLHDSICPWCIADGSAAARFDAEFVDLGGEVASLSNDVQEVLARRTVSHTGWQQVEWLAHCGDAMTFIGMADASRLKQSQGAVEALRTEFSMWDDDQFVEFLGWLRIEGSPTAYLYRCGGCGAYRANADFD